MTPQRISLGMALLALTLGLAACNKAGDTAANGTGAAADPNTAEMPDFGGVEVVEVKVDGVGPTRDAAILDGLNLAVRQVNGVPLAGISLNSQGSLDYGQSGSNAFGITNETVLSVTQGSVKGFAILSEKPGAVAKDDPRTPSWRISLKVEVNKYKPSAAAKLTKIMVLAPRTTSSSFTIGDQTMAAADVGSAIRDQIGDVIGKSGRFAVIDRQFDADINQELAQIAPGTTANQDIAKLGQRLTVDLLVIPEIKRLAYIKSGRTLRYSGRELRSYAGGIEMTFHVVNVATGLKLMSETYRVELPSTPPSVFGSQAVGLNNIRSYIADLSSQFSKKLITGAFPVIVVKLSGRSLVLSQGQSMLDEGASYELVKMGEKITDPQTGSEIGRLEEPAGTVRITKAMDRMSFGLLLSGAVDPQSFRPGQYELRGKLAAGPESRAASTAAAPSSADAQPATGRAAPPAKRAGRREKDLFDADFADPDKGLI
ncbi:MAG: hypothetical protein WCO11_11105 [Sphingomonadales bacterium]|jgi:curli biogenesis system outer membrane secretion channel CsgG